MRFYRAFAAGRCQPSHVSLFRRDGAPADLAGHLLAQDLVYVGGGSLISLLGTWTAHGIDLMLRAAWERGVVMAGLSAGSLCWFDHGITAFHGESKPVKGLGFLPFSNAVHYDDKPERRSAYRLAIADGMPAGLRHRGRRGTALRRRPARRVWSRRDRPRGRTMSPSMVAT